MASSKPAQSPAANKRAVADDGVCGAVAGYVEELQCAALATRTRAAYASHVVAYGCWLAGRPQAAAALVVPRARDHAVRDFKRHLRLERGCKAASVNLALAAVDHFNRFLGLGPAMVSREALVHSAPRALSLDEQRALVRATEDCKPRDRAIVVLAGHRRLETTRRYSLAWAADRQAALERLEFEP